MEIPLTSIRELERKPLSDHDVKKSEPVIAKVPQSYEAKINIRLVPAVNIGNKVGAAKCLSRNETGRFNAKPIDFPEAVKKKFDSSNKQVMEWLEASPENANLFLTDPIGALLRANVELTRPEQKELSRIFQEVSTNYILDPNTEIKEIMVTAYPKGSVGHIKEIKEIRKHTDDCGCK